MHCSLSSSLLLLLSFCSLSSAVFKRRRVVDLVFTHNVMNKERDMMLPTLAEQFAVQMHSADTTDCKDLVNGLVRGEDDFLVLISISPVTCPNEVCRKNFANVVLPVGGGNDSRIVYFGCNQNNTETVEWPSIAREIRHQQKDNVLEDVPSDYRLTTDGQINRGILAGFCVMGLVIVGLFILVIFLNVKHAKEVKTLKGVGTEEKSKKSSDGPKLAEDKTEKSSK